jgi:hypothetical protein
LDLAKQYLSQCLVAAANNLRLSSEKIETVAILRERLTSSENLTEEIKNFKKVTELSKLGIRLSEIQSFIESGKLEFSKLSDKFKEHSYGLVRELNSVLDVLTPQTTRATLAKFDKTTTDIELGKNNSTISVDKSETIIQNETEIELPRRSRADELREAIIFDELSKDTGFNFENFEENVLRHVKELDSFLDKVVKYDFTENEINRYIKLMNENAELSKGVGFEILSNMHNIFSKGLELIKQKKISVSSNVVESLRACLIVIVAVVRGKEVDITNYLTRAENFGITIFPKQKEK